MQSIFMQSYLYRWWAYNQSLSIDQLINLHYQSTIDQLDRSSSNHYYRIMVYHDNSKLKLVIICSTTLYESSSSWPSAGYSPLVCAYDILLHVIIPTRYGMHRPWLLTLLQVIVSSTIMHPWSRHIPSHPQDWLSVSIHVKSVIVEPHRFSPVSSCIRVAG